MHPILPRSPRSYPSNMRSRSRRTTIRTAALAASGAFVLLSSACLGYPMEGAVATPPPPGSTGESRLPSLLSQLQGSGAGMEVFDGSQSEVLGAQDGENAGVTVTPAPAQPTATPTPPGDKGSSGPGPTPVQTVAGANTPNPSPGGSNEGPGPTATPTPSPTPGQASEATPTPSPTPTNTPTPTATPTPALPPSETGPSGGPQSEAT